MVQELAPLPDNVAHGDTGEERDSPLRGQDVADLTRTGSARASGYGDSVGISDISHPHQGDAGAAVLWVPEIVPSAVNGANLKFKHLGAQIATDGPGEL